MATIGILDEQTVSQVAAGEVVDRPASVVKELVENSLDAGASRIEVELSDGGISTIKVTDDGVGMGGEDAEVCAHRHATSKITEIGDLFRLKTLGFRGEALSAIAAVAGLTLLTATRELAPRGIRVESTPGGEPTTSPDSHPGGTTVFVERLFAGVPARHAFLKSPRSEQSAVVEMLSHLAIASPRVGFSLKAEAGKTLLSLAPAGEDMSVMEALGQRMSQIHGRELGKALRVVEGELSGGAGTVRGLVSLPSLTARQRGKAQTLIVNGRWVRSCPPITAGIDNAYHASLPSGRHPYVALSVDLDPEAVDVNVHPAKSVVKLSAGEGGGVASALTSIIRHSLTDGGDGDLPGTTGGDEGDGESRGQGGGSVGPPPPTLESPTPTPPESVTTEAGGAGALAGESRGGSGAPPESVSVSPPPHSEAGVEQPGWGASDGGAPSPPPPSRGDLPDPSEVEVIGQAGLCYIVAEDSRGVWMVDQHAAHERAILDRLGAGEGEGLLISQPLLTPLVVEVPDLASAEEVVAHLEQEGTEEGDTLARHGFAAERFGPRAFRVSAVPAAVAERDPAGAFREAVEALISGIPQSERIAAMVATIACKAAVKKNDRLNRHEMETLIGEWLGGSMPATCPHGRSICFCLDHPTLERSFDRR